MLRLNLMAMETPKRFQDMCFRIARAEFPEAQAVAFASWDGGRDIVQFVPPEKGGDIVWQCKFSKSLGADTKKAIVESLDRIHDNYHPKLTREHRAHLTKLRRTGVIKAKARRHRVARWILCVPTAATGKFRDWLRAEMEGRKMRWEIWDETELLRRLERHPEIVDAFFYPILEELQRYFETEDLALLSLKFDKACQWRQPDKQVNSFMPSGNVVSPDLLLDVIVRNKGSVETVVTNIEVQVRDVFRGFHGVPGEGLLFSQITYALSIEDGVPGDYIVECEPPLLVKAKRLERFKVNLRDTGYAWTGRLRLILHYGAGKQLALPWLRIST